MKKSFIFMFLALFLCACSTQPPQPATQRTLLSFADLADEITVLKVAGPVTAAAPQATDDRPDNATSLASRTGSRTVVH